MRFFIRLYCLCSFFSLLLFACDTTPPPTEPLPNELSPSTAVSFTTFLQGLQQTGTAIPVALSDAYIAPALAYDSLYPYLDTSKASYQYGEIVYEDSSLVALSFYYKALDGSNLLAASFLASYDRVSGTCLGIRPIFSSSTFDWRATKGYQLGLSCRSTLHYIDNGSAGVLRLESTVKRFYSAFEEGFVPPSGGLVVSTSEHFLGADGRFLTVGGVAGEET